MKKRRKAATVSREEPTERQKRLEMCRLELKAVLEKYQLELRGIPAFTQDGRVEVSIIFVEAPPKPKPEQQGG